MSKQEIQAWLQAYARNGYLNGAVHAKAYGDTLANEAFGCASFEHRVPNATRTKFRIGSLTKSFTAMAVHVLHQSGALDIDRPIGDYLPDYPDGGRITIEHCLGNCTGIPDFAGKPDYWFRTMRLPSSPQDMIERFRSEPLEFEPGSRFGYSNSNYVVLTAIIELVSGQTFGDFLQERICGPLGLLDTGVDDGRAVIPGLASGYTVQRVPMHAEYADMSFPTGAFGLYSTAEDLSAWCTAVYESALLSPDMTERLLTPRHGYANGWFPISREDGRSGYAHFGDVSGFASYMAMFPERQSVVIVLSNIGLTPAAVLGGELEDALFGKPVELPRRFAEDSAPHADLQGTYSYADTNEYAFDIGTESDIPYITLPKMYGVRYPLRLRPIGRDEWATEMIHERVKIGASGEGEHRDWNGTVRPVVRNARA